jgi:hypothetical protein
MFSCEKCEYTTVVKQNYNKHTFRKFKCVPPVNNVVPETVILDNVLPNDTQQHTFYIVDSDPHISNKSIKIGFVTTSHKALFNRYQTCFGKRMIIYVFVCYHKTGRQVETEFKKQFVKFHGVIRKIGCT